MEFFALKMAIKNIIFCCFIEKMILSMTVLKVKKCSLLEIVHYSLVKHSLIDRGKQCSMIGSSGFIASKRACNVCHHGGMHSISVCYHFFNRFQIILNRFSMVSVHF